MTTQELIEWYKNNRAEMPSAPFQLAGYIKVVDTDAFYRKLDKDVEEFPDILGSERFVSQLKMLHKFVTES